jgi:hypothetical protein
VKVSVTRSALFRQKATCAFDFFWSKIGRAQRGPERA